MDGFPPTKLVQAIDNTKKNPLKEHKNKCRTTCF
jgi:hypothetical protein